ncbi:hypothetical protein AMR72_02665 [Flavobacterium psychrophilum]|nr:hypothetical protein AMR72_02665 [Flavobacterium psychrophilum]AOE51514.1 hypothetical protein ALW18_02665 [Flavobacterium psychrophilum]
MRSIYILVLLFLTLNFYAKSRNDFDKIADQIGRLSFTEPGTAHKLVNNLYAIAKSHPEKKQLLPLCLYWESVLFYAQGIADDKIEGRISKTLKQYNEGTYPFEHALLLHSLALNDVIIGNYTEALANSLNALTVYKKLDNPLFAARVLQLLGVICHRTRNYEMAENFLKESLVKESPTNEYYKSLINMHSAQLLIPDKKPGAIKSMNALIPVIEKYNDKGLKAVLYLNLGGGYFLNNERDKAYPFYEKALGVNKRIQNESFTVSLLINYTTYCVVNGKYADAKRYIDEAEKIALHLNNAEQISLVYLVAFSLYESINDLPKSHEYLKKYNVLKDKIASSSSTIDSYQAYVSSFLKSAEKEVTISREEAKMEKRRGLIYLAFGLFLVLLTAAILVIVQQKRHQMAIIKESEKSALEKQLLFEKTIHQINAEKHKEVLAAKEREVTSYSLILSNKNNVLQEVLSETRQLKKVLNPGAETAYKNIIKTINDNLNKDPEQHKFMYHFNEVHPDFFNKLKDLCPDLTENNLRICAYFKMGMSNKQVAAILNISVETVKNGRYRLKKKLRLGEDENLDDFLRSF